MIKTLNQSKEKTTSNKLETTKRQISEEELKELWKYFNPEASKKRAEAAEKIAKELCRQFAILNEIKYNEKNISNH